jgi:hypothetical protein
MRVDENTATHFLRKSAFDPEAMLDELKTVLRTIKNPSSVDSVSCFLSNHD